VGRRGKCRLFDAGRKRLTGPGRFPTARGWRGRFSGWACNQRGQS
jgi:hypothetical protein